MSRTSLIALVSLAAACTAGPEQPANYVGRAVELRAHLADPPAEALSEPLQHVSLSLEPVVYCQPTTLDPGGPAPDYHPDVYRFSFGVPFDPAASIMTLPAISGGNLVCPERSGPQSLRFFQPNVVFTPGSREVRWVSPQHFVAYTPGPATFSPFGSVDPPLVLPAGYSLLRRSCGPRQALTVASLDEVVEFQRVTDRAAVAAIGRPQLELDERRFLQTCGVRPAAEDLGMRVGLDAAHRLAWSPDGSSLHYLTRVGEGATPPHNLRSTPSAGGAPVELARDLRETELRAPLSGELFVRDLAGVPLRGRRQGEGPWQFEPAPGTNVSPDGRWVLFSGEQGPQLWEVSTGVTRALENGGFYAWSADSRLAYLRFAPSGPEVSVWSADAPDAIAHIPGTDPAWLPDGNLRVRISEGPQGSVVGVLAPDLSARGQFGFPRPASDMGRSLSPFWDKFLWTGERLVRVEPAQGWNVALVQGKAGGISLGDAPIGLAMQQPDGGQRRVLLPADARPIDEPLALGGPSNSFLLWTRSCLGLFETVCSYTLHRFSLPDATDQVVAVSDEAPVMAVSPDGKRLAISNRRGIFVKDLP
jgi:hypothetical protein